MLLYLDTIWIFVAFPETFEMRMILFQTPLAPRTFARNLHFMKSGYSIGQHEIGRLVRTYVGSMKPMREYGNY
jgi:hypothetical protein